MLKIIDNDIYREGQKIGYIDGNDIRDNSGHKLGYFIGNTVYDERGIVAAKIEGNYVYIGSRQIELQKILKRVVTTRYPNIVQVALAVLFGEI